MQPLRITLRMLLLLVAMIAVSLAAFKLIPMVAIWQSIRTLTG